MTIKKGTSAMAPSQEPKRPVTAKLSMTMFDQITAVATLKRTSAAEVIREGIGAYLTQRLKDETLPAQIEASMSRHRAKIAVLTGGEVGSGRSVAPPSRARAEDEKSVSLRISDSDLDKLTSFALLDDTAVADQLRRAVSEYIETFRDNVRLQEAIEESRETHRQILAALA
jgi:hypothetical protein